ncbi:MAG: LLM class flavin-dependent oxidoreductase [Acidimicrobiia bacterium]
MEEGPLVPLKLGICLWSQAAEWSDMLNTARLVDRLEYEHLWTWDHLLSIYGEPDQPIFEAWSVLAAIAASTENVLVGPLVTANTFRSPALLAKIATTIDHISGGRAILGIGGGWFEQEHLANAIDFGSGFGERLDRMDEAVALIRSLFLGERITSDGPYYPVKDLRHEPRPVRGDIPILVGGRGKLKTLRTVARHAQIWNAYGTPQELVEHDAMLQAHCRDVGRDHTEIERSVQAKVIIRDTAEEAEAAFVRLLSMNRTTWAGKGRGAEPDMVRRQVFPDPDSAIWLGSPEQIAARITSYLDVGFGTVIAEIPAPYDIETIERLIGEVAPMVDARRWARG